ncbi:nucleoporin Nup85-like protein [Piptocephalis cylindrospora]|uniref:Nuclear pore complex protein Nup85 n=1 Tax=Piptocephalis cylindrospora TaxID=1907219 RepID=A0A4V1IXK9_9FUNG|nr:nucleoporin Nup85-like protein [Piptocephalis cylindrospora]|eukprot:RKP11419.1 nucleoporin Nup85-like protein [Piptocephalis cylindrospora]
MLPLITEGSAIFRQSLRLEGPSTSLFATTARHLEKNIQGLADKYSKAIGRHLAFLLSEQEEMAMMEESHESTLESGGSEDGSDYPESKELTDLNNQIFIAKGRRLLWGFAAALYLIPPTEPVGPGLAQWQISCSPGKVRRVLDQSAQITSSIDWKVYEKMALLCLLSELTDSLQTYQGGGSDHNVARALLALLQNRPSLEKSHSRSDFADKWRMWLKSVVAEKERLRSIDITYPFRLLDILSGDARAILEASRTWSEAYVALAYHSDPSADALSLRPLGRKCMQAFGLADTAKTLEEAEEEEEEESETFLDCVRALIEGRFILAMEGCKVMDGWMGAHLADLFARRGYLEDPRLRRQQGQGEVTLRQYFIMDYATELWNAQDTWEVSGTYFGECGALGKAHLQELITTVPVRTEAQLVRILDFCVKYNLRHQYREILRVWGMRLFRQGRPIPAIDRLAQADCGDIVNEIIRDVFNRCVRQENCSTEEETLVPISKRLPVNLQIQDEGMNKRKGLEKRFPAFRTLLNYQRFQKLMATDGVNTESARLLSSLLTSPYTPSTAIRRLYAQLVAFLEKDHCK